MTELNNEQIQDLSSEIEKIFFEIKKIIVGQEEMIEKVLVAILADGHVLLEGAPGLAKTKTLQTFSEVISSNFKRIQFTPDLLPADLLGTRIYNRENNCFETVLGPIFANLLLADEINRAPAKVQSALLEAMQEKQVTIGKETFKLNEPFLTLATQNPIESEGTYSLPEAQLDRFMFKILVDYPSKEEEAIIVQRMTSKETIKVNTLMNTDKILEFRDLIKQVYVDEKIINYIVEIVNETRNTNSELKEYIEYGASPRASLAITKAIKALAVIRGRTFATTEDVNYIANDCLRHRIILTYEALAEDIDTDYIINKIIEKIKKPITTKEI